MDAIHTRIGAADDLANAQSTFMLEMTEAAQILYAATPHSLVLMDEIGRGTSTFDGLALASGIAAHLHDRTQAFTLFATHYFELTGFPASHHAAVNVHVSATESGSDIVFLHEIQPGPASRSYGIQVARLAGLPPSVVGRAREILNGLERDELSRGGRPSLSGDAAEKQRQLGLFQAPSAEDDAVHRRLRAIDVNAMTPMQALALLAELKDEAGE
jgi:DNA mismatch repair protein MutS